MKVPGFTADLSVYRSRGPYVTGPVATSPEGIVPQGFWCEASCWAGFALCEGICGVYAFALSGVPVVGIPLAIVVGTACSFACTAALDGCLDTCRGVPPLIPSLPVIPVLPAP
jgi:hypothetical protein